MAQKFLTPIDLTKNELQNARIQNLATAPSSPAVGQIYYDTTDNYLKMWNGVDWLFSAQKLEGQTGAYYRARTNHTGTQLAATISDFDTQVRTSRLDQMAAPTADVSMATRKLTNLAEPTAAQDAATKNYVDGIASGIDHKASVRAATTANITLSAPQTVDGVAVIAGDRVLVKNQSTPAQNGIYLVAAGAWVRTNDMDVWAEVPSAFTFVEEGTGQKDTSWVSTADQGGTLNTTAITWTQFGAPGSISASNQGTGIGVYDTQVGSDLQFRNVKGGSSKLTATLVTKDITLDVVESALTHDNIGGTLGIAKGGTGQVTAAAAIVALGGTRKYATSVGNGAATSIAVNHALNTTDVHVQVKEVAGGLAMVYPDVVVTDANNVTVAFTVAPAANQYRVIVIG